MREGEILVLRKRPGERTAKLCKIENSLKAFQEEVDGYIEVVHFGRYALICNGEGKLLELDANFIFGGDLIVGTALFAQVDGDEFVSIEEPADLINEIDKINLEIEKRLMEGA